MKDVYTIVLFEQSPKVFHAYKDVYKHNFEQKSDSGLKLDLLQKYIFVPLDIFGKIVHTKGIRNELEAWFLFFSTDDPENIVRLITEYPEFKPLYEHLYDVCRNIEKVMGMFPKELQIMDRNTVRYMIDQMQEDIDRKDKQLEEKDRRLDAQMEQLSAKDREIEKLKRMLGERD